MRVRTVEVLRGAWGAAMIIAPRFVIEHVHHTQGDRVSVAVARVLGARHLAQAALTVVSPSRDMLALAVWVDCSHASTALALALVDRTRVRVGLTETAVALTWAGTGLRDLRAAAPGTSGWRDAAARVVLGRVPGGKVLSRIVPRRGAPE